MPTVIVVATEDVLESVTVRLVSVVALVSSKVTLDGRPEPADESDVDRVVLGTRGNVSAA